MFCTNSALNHGLLRGLTALGVSRFGWPSLRPLFGLLWVILLFSLLFSGYQLPASANTLPGVDVLPKVSPTPPTPKIYEAFLEQSGENTPNITIIQNTLGFTPVWQRSGPGYYRLVAPAGSFPLNKTTVSLVGGRADGEFVGIYNFSTNGGDAISVYSALPSGVLSDDVMAQAIILIKVYP